MNENRVMLLNAVLSLPIGVEKMHFDSRDIEINFSVKINLNLSYEHHMSTDQCFVAKK